MNQKPLSEQAINTQHWRHDPGLVTALGLSPLAVISTSAIYGLALGIATMLSLLFANGFIAVLRRFGPPELNALSYMIAIGIAVGAIELAMNAWFHPLYQALSLFIPLIAAHGVILERAEFRARKGSVRQAATHALAIGASFTLILTILGGLREIASQGVLFSRAELLFGSAASQLALPLFPHSQPFLLAALPPGAFFVLAFMTALHRWLTRSSTQHTATSTSPSIRQAS
jgi:electron transport complex protein RnfE